MKDFGCAFYFLKKEVNVGWWGQIVPSRKIPGGNWTFPVKHRPFTLSLSLAPHNSRLVRPRSSNASHLPGSEVTSQIPNPQACLPKSNNAGPQQSPSQTKPHLVWPASEVSGLLSRRGWKCGCKNTAFRPFVRLQAFSWLRAVPPLSGADPESPSFRKHVKSAGSPPPLNSSPWTGEAQV